MVRCWLPLFCLSLLWFGLVAASLVPSIVIIRIGMFRCIFFWLWLCRLLLVFGVLFLFEFQQCWGSESKPRVFCFVRPVQICSGGERSRRSSRMSRVERCHTFLMLPGGNRCNFWIFFVCECLWCVFHACCSVLCLFFFQR